MYIQDSYTLETHDDVLKNLCEELYVKKQQLL